MTKRHPIQPLEKDKHGHLRFKANKIVDFMAEKIGLNTLSGLDFPDEDWEQLAQLIGYSFNGFMELSYTSEEVATAAQVMYDQGVTATEARLQAQDERVATMKEHIKELYYLADFGDDEI